MITCLNCKSTNVKVLDMNFAHVKLEGQPAVKHTYNKYSFYCLDCEKQWESDPDAEKNYFEYKWLHDRTTMIVSDMCPDGSYGPSQNIDSNELIRCHELAKKIISSYKHTLDLEPGEWHEIEMESQ